MVRSAEMTGLVMVGWISAGRRMLSDEGRRLLLLLLDHWLLLLLWLLLDQWRTIAAAAHIGRNGTERHG